MNDGDALGAALPAADAGLVVPDQPAWDPPQLLDQLPGPQQQVLGLPGRDHPPGHEPRMRGGDHQHRQQLGGAVLERDLPRREPQIALRRVTGRPGQPVGRIDRPVLGTQPLHVVAEPPDRPAPAHPLGQHRRRHVRGLLQQRPHPRLEHRERRRPRRPLIPRRRIRVHRLDHRGPRDPQPLRDPCLRHPLSSQPPDQRPVLQSDHSPIVECSLFTAETVQFSSAADTGAPITAATNVGGCPWNRCEHRSGRRGRTMASAWHSCSPLGKFVKDVCMPAQARRRSHREQVGHHITRPTVTG